VFTIADLPLGAGRIGLCPLPGRCGDYAGDMAVLRAWRPDIVLTLVSEIELEAGGAEELGRDLAREGIAWWHLPVTDFRSPCNGTASLWPIFSSRALEVLARGGRVLAHCYGGCGRSGMALMRLMVDAGEDPQAALARLRKARPCAVETAAQATWAAGQPPGAGPFSAAAR
jgi:protein-tyrosine phosphatase